MDISVKESPWFGAILQTQATRVNTSVEPAATRISTLPSKKEAVLVTSFTAKEPPRHAGSSPARMLSLRGKLAGVPRKRGPEENHSLGLPRQKRSSSSKLLLSPSYIPRGLHCRVHKCHFGHSTYRRPEENTAEIQLTAKEAPQCLLSVSKIQPALPSPSTPKLW